MVEGEEARRLHSELAQVLIRNGYAHVVTEASAADETSDGSALVALIDAAGMTFAAAFNLPSATLENLERHDISGIALADPETGETTVRITRDQAFGDRQAAELLGFIEALREVVTAG